MKQKIKEFINKETVLTAAWVLAAVSAVFVPPDREYAGYIDFETLGVLFSLMAVMAGLKKCGFFTRMAEKLLSLAGGGRGAELMLVLMCFFFSMFITNDVALITFVPLTMTALKISGNTDRIIFVAVMETVAANLGSMAMPFGNPQNLYLYTKSGMKLTEFFSVTLIYASVSLVFIILFMIFTGGGRRKNKTAAGECSWSEKNEADTSGGTLRGRRKETDADMGNINGKAAGQMYGRKTVTYFILFVACILAVAGIIPIWIITVTVTVTVIIADRRVLAEIDYGLLLTFAGFFIFVGNMGRIPWIEQKIMTVLTGNEVVTSVAVSQAISNVPAAILLSGFTENFKGLLVGTNIGGLGTLIASMASLISYRLVTKEYHEKKGSYIKCFTVVNVIFLVLLMAVWQILN